MFERFNLYDFYAYFVPGTVVGSLLGAIFYSLHVLFKGRMPALPDVQLGDSILLLLLAYVTGHLLQSVLREWSFPPGAVAERQYHQLLLLGRPIPRLDWRLRYFCPRTIGLRLGYTDTLRRRIVEALEQRFVLGPLASPGSKEEQEQLADDYFRLAYEYVVSKNLSPHAPVYNGLYAMHRALYFLSLLIACSSCLESFVHCYLGA